MGLAEALAERSNRNTNDGGAGNEEYKRNASDNDVCFVTVSYGAKQIESKCKNLGIRLVGIDLGENFRSDETMRAYMNQKVSFPTLANASKPFIEEALDDFQPDVVVSDFGCLASQEYAASRNIPLVINWTGPFLTLTILLQSVINVGENDFYFAAGGLFISYVGLGVMKLLFFFNVKDLGTMGDRIRKSVNCGNSLVLVNSFWGLEKPQQLFYPNIVPVGRIEKPLPRSADFSETHPELHAFLHTARAKERKVLLVTTGTIVRMSPWIVRVLWEAFERLSREHTTSIVWSLTEDRQEFLSEAQLQHPAFHFSTWLPQPKLLASDLVDGVFTHCGWGGTRESIAGAKPVVTLPFIADQMVNAKLLIDAGCAIAVTKIPFFNLDHSGNAVYAPAENLGFGPKDLWKRFRLRNHGRLSAETVAAACARLLTDPKYTIAARRLRALSTGPGMGPEFACDRIEHAGKHGLEHLTERGPGPRPATHATRLTGHRPLAVTLVLGAVAVGFVLSAIWAFGAWETGKKALDTEL